MISTRGTLLALGLAPALLYLTLDLLGLGGAVVRGGIGAVLTLTFPGLLVAPALSRLQGPAWDRAAFALLSFALSALAVLLNLTILKLLGLPVTAPSLLGLGLVEGAAGVGVWWRRAPRFEAITSGGPLALAIIAGAVCVWGVTHWPWMLRDLDRYFYHGAPMEGAYEGSEDWSARGLEAELTWEGGGLDGGGSPSKGALTGTYAGEGDALYRIFLLLHGPIGARLRVDCGDASGVAEVLRDVVEEPEEGAVPRYLTKGVGAISLPLRLQPGEGFTCALLAEGPPGSLRVVNLSGVPDWGFYEEERTQGFVLSHYYQILNIVENVRWAEEIAQDRWLTIHQPFLWSYVYGAVVIYGGAGLIALNVFFLALIAGLGALAFRVLQQVDPDLPGIWALPVALMALSHAFIIQASGSTNFPDTLYALALMGMFFGLARRQPWLFVTYGVMASFLRYPGSTVALMAALIVFALDPHRRGAARQGGLAFLGILLIPCALLGLGALVSGQLGHWVEILYFETFPEHFHDNYDLAALLARPPEFYALWMTYAGFTPLLLIGGVRGAVPRAAALLALAYSPFLCFIDHFPSHYFLPLLALTGVAVVGSVAQWRAPLRWGGLALACAGLLRWLLFGVP